MSLASSIPLCTTESPSTVAAASGLDAAVEDGASEAVSYRLLELPKEIAELIEEAQSQRREDLPEASSSSGAIDASASERKRKRGNFGGDAKNEGPHLVINGRHHDEAVLCTANRTYALREVSQSNSLLLCSIDTTTKDKIAEEVSRDAEALRRTLQGPRLSLRSNVSSLLELAPVVPRLERITSLLKASVYEGEDEERSKVRPHACSDIVYEADPIICERVKDVIRQERFGLLFRRATGNYNWAMTLDASSCWEHMRMMDPAFLKSLLRSLILIVEANAYLPGSVPIREATRALEQDHANSLRPEISLALITRWFGRQTQADMGDADESGHLTAALDIERIAHFLGEQLLIERARQPFSYTTLLDEWRNLLGDTLLHDLSNRSSSENALDDDGNAMLGSSDLLRLLRGHYLLHPAPPALPRPPSQPLQIQYYPSSHLPLEAAPRFQELFLTRPSWLLEDLEPFIADLAVEPKRREALLLRFARAKSCKVPGPAKAKPPAKDRSTSMAGRRPGTGIATSEATMREVVLYSARVRY